MSADHAIPVHTLTLHTSAEEGATVVRCTGRLTIETSEILKTEVRPLLGNKCRVVLDLTDWRRWTAPGSALWSGFTSPRNAQGANYSW